MTTKLIDWEDTPWTFVRQGVERKAFSGDGATVALNRVLPGNEPMPHSHEHEQIAYIIKGTIRFHVGDEQHLLTAGSLLVVPPNVVHWGEVVGDEEVLNLDIFTPRRPEYAA
jgi:quercetin dioxygenase-like cupin family protein